jgi:hypothetical protein
VRKPHQEFGIRAQVITFTCQYSAAAGALLLWCKCPSLLGCLQALLVQLIHRRILGCRRLIVAQIPQCLRLVHRSWLCRGGPGFVGLTRWVAAQHSRLMLGRRHCRGRRSSRCGPGGRARSGGLRVDGSCQQPSASKSQRGTPMHRQLHGHVNVLPNFHYGQRPAHTPSFDQPNRELDPIARSTGQSSSAAILSSPNGVGPAR